MLTTRMLLRSPRRTALVVAAAAIVVLAVPLAWYLASPLFLTQAVKRKRACRAGAKPPGRRAIRRCRRHSQRRRRCELWCACRTAKPVLRLEDDFRVTNGPDLYVYLSGSAAPRTSAELHGSRGFRGSSAQGQRRRPELCAARRSRSEHVPFGGD